MVGVAAIVVPRFAGLALHDVIALWTIFFGLSMSHAAFFMRRGLKVFGLLYALVGLAILFVPLPQQPSPLCLHGTMGWLYGLELIGFGVYLKITAKPATTDQDAL